MKIVIIGGVAAGASAAARLRRLDESAEIVILERGEFISYANCGLPYHVGGAIESRDSLLVMPAAKFASWFNVDVRTSSEACAINRGRKTVSVRGVGGEYEEPYDKLIIATGSSPAEDLTPGAKAPRIKNLWTIADMDSVLETIRSGAKNAIIIGGGFVGLETAENLSKRGLGAILVQRGNHLLPSLDFEMARPIADELASMGVGLRLGRKVAGYEASEDSAAAILDDGERLEAGLVIVSTGVRPNSELAAAAGLECGKRGHIRVNENMRTSDPDIYAAGDAVEVRDPLFGGSAAIPLAGPANRQGRIAADNIAGIASAYAGTYGASVIKVGRICAGSVGYTEARLKAAGKPFKKAYLHPSSNASYYPGAARMDMKIMFDCGGKILGAQIVGEKGVDKRIDTIAQAMRNGTDVCGLGELELAYAPPFSSAKDPVNFAGFVASNILSGLSTPAYAESIPEGALVLDVREAREREGGYIPGSVNIPLGQLRARLGELDKNRAIVASCQVGLRGYLAERILKQHGFNASNLSGGYLTWKAVNSK